jgi:hypothetical protein
MRKGVVLFITLSVIAAMLALVGAIFSYLDKSKKDASLTTALIQSNLLYRDASEVLKTSLGKAGKDQNMKDTVFDMLYFTPITFKPEKSDLFAMINCKPLANGVNINWLGFENNSSKQMQFIAAQTVLDRILEQNNIQDATLLREKLRSQLNSENSATSESQNRLSQKKGIITLEQLKTTARDYRFGADDPAIERIEWEKFFSFSDPEVLIDANYLSAELIAILFEMELEFVQKEWIQGDDLKEFLETNGADISTYSNKLFSDKPIEQMYCRINYGHQEHTYAFGFEYIAGRGENFEFYGEQ